MRTRKRHGRRMSFDVFLWVTKILESLDSPVSLSVYLLMKYKQWDQVAKKSVSPLDYQNPLDFFLDYQAVKILSKYPYMDTKIDRKRAAIGKFLEAEGQCFLTNERIREYSGGDWAFKPSRPVNQVLHLARRKISHILGEVPSLDSLDFRFGPGASFGVRGDTSVYKKLTSDLECTFAFAPMAPSFLAEFPGWVPEGPARLNLVPGSELTFVPKDAKTDRPICIEPLLNGLFQKGVGSYIRNRLARHGVNLRDQSINQGLAQRAFFDGLSTVDFSSASDTISYMLVLELLPIDWFQFLDAARSPSYFMEGNWYDFHKFTSMGNAYTFELETLIFYALATASCESLGVSYQTSHNLHVYGDDVIIPRAAFRLFLEACSYCGFTINEEKSFVDGPFFESCGCDYYIGYNVRPYLLKKRVKTLQDHYYVSNCSLAIAARIQSLRGWHDDDFIRRRVNSLRDVHAWCVGCIPRGKRFLVPQGAGDVGLHCDFDIAVPTRHEQWDGWTYRGLCPLPVRIVADFPMSYALYHAGMGCPEGWWDLPSQELHSEGYVPRSKVSRFVVRKGYWPGDWGSLDVKWSERAISHVRKGT